MLGKVLQSDGAGGPSAGQSVDCLNKLDDGGEKEMYFVLLITPKATNPVPYIGQVGSFGHPE